MNKPWRVLHLDIEGSTIDRELGHSMLNLEMHPIGTQLPEDRQTVELRVRIGGSKTVLDKNGIEELKAFLEMKP